MSETAVTVSDKNTLVVLLALELIDLEKDVEDIVRRLRDATDRKERSVRILLRIANTAGVTGTPNAFEKQVAVAHGLLATGVPAQVILASSEGEFETDCLTVRMPPGGDVDELALALSDVVFVDPIAHGSPLAVQAKKSGKIVIEPGNHLPQLHDTQSISEGLDPYNGTKVRIGSRIFGRFQLLMEGILSFDGSGPKGFRGGIQRLCNDVKRSWSSFDGFPAPSDDCRSPDERSFDEASPIVRCFKALDRSAVYGSFLHRDAIWASVLFAGSAVLAAIAGTLSNDHRLAFVEAVFLIAFASLSFWVRYTKLEERWSACREGAEQLRIIRLCLPLMIATKCITSADTPSSVHRETPSLRLRRNVVDEVKRAVREHGLPTLRQCASAKSAARWVRYVVRDQLTYSRGAHIRLERREHRMRWFTGFLLAAAIVAVASPPYSSHARDSLAGVA